MAGSPAKPAVPFEFKVLNFYLKFVIIIEILIQAGRIT